MSRIDPKSRAVDHSISNPTVNGQPLYYSFGWFQNTPMGQYSGPYLDRGSFLHLHNCASLVKSALGADIGLVMIRHQLLRFHRLGLSSYTVWPQKPGKSHRMNRCQLQLDNLRVNGLMSVNTFYFSFQNCALHIQFSSRFFGHPWVIACRIIADRDFLSLKRWLQRDLNYLQ